MNLDRTYREPSTGKSFGTNAFKMLKYATEHPGCILECFNPVDRTTKQKTFLESSVEEKGDNVIVTTISQEADSLPETVICTIRKQDWE